jgi:TolA-binding protein
MFTSGRLVLFLAALLVAVPRLVAAPSPEERAFKDAEKSFHDMIWDRAEGELATFVQTYTNSPRVAEALLFQGEARFWQSNYVGAIDLLSENQNRAGPLADEFRFWIAESRLHRGEFKNAADTFASMVRDFTNSPRRLRAVVEEASARSEMEQWSQVINLLEQTNGVFEIAARTNASADLLADGFLLLAQAHLAANSPQAAELVLDRLSKLPLDAATDWHRSYLLCRIKLAEGHPDKALGNVTNLFELAEKSGQVRLKADSFSLEASILQRLDRISDAIASYTNNLALGVPAERRREAWLKIGELSLAQRNVAQAAQTLQQYLVQFTNAPAEDVAWLTLGELRLREALGGSGTNLLSDLTPSTIVSTNALEQAVQALTNFVAKFPQSSLFGKAQLTLGWCYWAARTIPQSQAAFQVAIQRLPPSPDQVMAYFKLGDTEFRQTNLTAAIGHYRAVVEKFPSMPEAQTNFVEPALYQIVRAGLGLGDIATASNALTQIVKKYPEGFHTDRAVLLSGQAIGQGNPEAARALFADFTRRAPTSPLRPEIELAIARTYEEQNRWPQAIEQYELWLNTFTNRPAEKARAEYSLAWASFRANRETNALTQFTNFIARFPTDKFAPRAQWWVADYSYGKGDITAAEQAYKWCYQNTNWPATSELAYQARLMAGRCAVKRYDWDHAKSDYFLQLIKDNNCPLDIQAQAWFALGDTFMSQVNPDSTNGLPDYVSAINAFDKIGLLFPSNPIVALAMGEKACCFLQLAQNSQDYARVTNGFKSVLDSPFADARARSIAKVGLGVTLEKLADRSTGPERSALLTEARDQYLDVFYGKNRREGEEPDLFWTREAGLRAGRLLADSLKQRPQAIAVYKTLQTMCPVLRLDDKINALRAQELEARQN